MQTKEIFSIKGIVAKYTTHVSAKNPLIYSEGYSLAANELESASGEEQLLSRLWFEHSHITEIEEEYKPIEVYIKFFKENIFSKDEWNFLLENYAEVIEYLFSIRDKWNIRPIELFSFASEMEELIAKTVTLQAGSKVFIPFIGYGDFAMKFPQCEVMGFTSSDEFACFVNIRMQAAGIKGHIYSKNSPEKLEDFLPTEKQDFICCDIVSEWLEYKDQFSLIKELKNKLNENGSMILLTSAAALVSNHKEAVEGRQFLVSECALDAIVQLPPLSKETSTIKFLIYATNRSNKDCAGVVMMDASQAIRNIGYNQSLTRLDVDWILGVLNAASDPNAACTKASDEIDKCMKVIPYAALDLDVFLPAFYLSQPINKENLVPLTDIVSVIKPTKDHLSTELTFDPKSLTDKFADAKISLQNAEALDGEQKKNRNLSKYIPAEPCVFLLVFGKAVKVGYSKKNIPDASIRTFSLFPCLRPKEGFSLEYIAALLLSDPVKKQLVNIAQGSTVARFNEHLLSKILIPIHNREQQLEMVNETAMASLSEREKMLMTERKQYERNIRLRKHALTQSLSSFGAMFNVLNNFRKKQSGFLADTDVVSQVRGTTVADVFEYLESRLKSIQTKLAAIADIDVDYGEAKHIDPQAFIKSYIASHETPWNNFIPVVSWSPQDTNLATVDLVNPEDGEVIIRKGEPLTTLVFPETALQHVFNNIVSNAISHGFTNLNRSDYKLRFSWFNEDTSVVIQIDNNGEPIPADVNSNDILSYGFSTKLNEDGHNGIGGSEIASIMEMYDGKVKVESLQDSDFTVRYTLTFEKTNIVASFGL